MVYQVFSSTFESDAQTFILDEDDGSPSGGVLQLAECFFSATNAEEFNLSCLVLNPHPATTFSIIRPQHYAINIDIPHQQAAEGLLGSIDSNIP